VPDDGSTRVRLARAGMNCALLLVLAAIFMLFWLGTSEAATPSAVDTRQPTPTWFPTATPEPPHLPCDADASDWMDKEWIDTVASRLRHWWKIMKDPRYDDWAANRVVALAVIAHESRGSPAAGGAAGEIGLFQVMPTRYLWCCEEANDLWESRKNIYEGLRILDFAARGAVVIDEGRGDWTLLVIAEHRQADLEFWYSDAGRTALAIYQCGLGNVAQFGTGPEVCGQRGGAVYAETILACWIPWIQSDVLDAGQTWEPTDFEPPGSDEEVPGETESKGMTDARSTTCGRAKAAVCYGPETEPRRHQDMDWQQIVEIAIVPFVPSVLVQAINIVWIGVFKQPKPSIKVIRWLCFGAAIAVTAVYTPLALPALPTTDDPVAFVGGIFAAGTAVILWAGALSVAAQVYYDKFLQPVLGGIGGKVGALLAPKR